MRTLLDIETWNRKDQFRFFSQFEEPFFGITVQVDCTEAYAFAKANHYSFFLYYLYQSLKTANQIEPFKYRIVEGNVYQYDVVNASPTINRPDGTFGFSYMDYHPDFTSFATSAQMIMEEVRNSTGLIPAVSGENVIHYSSIPWINFTSLSHARSFTFKDSCPKISFGKMTEVNGRKLMPLSIHVHHALMDGFHVGQYIDLYQQLLTEQSI
ncbi:MAG: chloramphenicol acetyltransferase [Sediminibacterium sp.]|jgi:chloramphenicol O-acetyltransferase type A|uniref:chloramphenicol acetyltransferase n=1 Tax=Sediminibacterium sp. TaxID=1917865 RepID=UPI002AB9C092|nr:chloramphenicol acetyltransferase [Sediminibacterium sp.]MDZ4071283.1 chloramphenicol acetyltransferase [Sediminibacterium sp.]